MSIAPSRRLSTSLHCFAVHHVQTPAVQIQQLIDLLLHLRHRRPAESRRRYRSPAESQSNPPQTSANPAQYPHCFERRARHCHRFHTFLQKRCYQKQSPVDVSVKTRATPHSHRTHDHSPSSPPAPPAHHSPTSRPTSTRRPHSLRPQHHPTRLKLRIPQRHPRTSPHPIDVWSPPPGTPETSCNAVQHHHRFRQQHWLHRPRILNAETRTATNRSHCFRAVEHRSRSPATGRGRKRHR